MALQNKDDVLSSGYKTPVFKTKTRGSNIRGSGSTMLMNADEIADAFGRPGYALTIFVEMDLHAASFFQVETGVCTFFQVITAAEFSTLFDKFIKKFVQCYGCESLETEFIISNSQIASKCGACGHVSDIAMKQKYKDYIRGMDIDVRLKNLSFEDWEEGEGEGEGGGEGEGEVEG